MNLVYPFQQSATSLESTADIMEKLYEKQIAEKQKQNSNQTKKRQDISSFANSRKSERLKSFTGSETNNKFFALCHICLKHSYRASKKYLFMKTQ